MILKLPDFEIDENDILVNYYGAGGHVVIPEGVKGIGEDAFNGSVTGNSFISAITSISLPSTLESIDPYVFDFCDALASFSVATGNTNFVTENGILYNIDKTTIVRYPQAKAGDSFDIPNTVETIGYSAFWHCTNLVSVEIPTSVETIQEAAFGECSSIISITIPNSVKSIEAGAFMYCSKLETISIAGSVAFLGNLIFLNCSSLQDIYVYWQNPSDTNEITYSRLGVSNDVYSNATLHIPEGTVEKYSAATNWKNFTNITDGTLTGCKKTQANNAVVYSYNRTIIIENTNDAVSVYDITGRYVSINASGKDAMHGVSTGTMTIPITQPGVYMVRIGNTIQKIVVK